MQDPDLDLVRSVRGWIAAWGAEVAAVRIDAARHRFADDVVAFGTHADIVTGLDALVTEQWGRIWPAIEDFGFRTEDLVVQASPDGLLAVAVVGWDSTGIAADGTTFDRPGRATVVLQRDEPGAPWIGTHTHFSLGRGVPSSSHGPRR